MRLSRSDRSSLFLTEPHTRLALIHSLYRIWLSRVILVPHWLYIKSDGVFVSAGTGVGGKDGSALVVGVCVRTESSLVCDNFFHRPLGKCDDGVDSRQGREGLQDIQQPLQIQKSCRGLPLNMPVVQQRSWGPPMRLGLRSKIELSAGNPAEVGLWHLKFCGELYQFQLKKYYSRMENGE